MTQDTLEPADRVLELALERVFRGPQALPDLAPSVRRAWERGQRGSAGPDDLLEPQPAVRALPRRARRPFGTRRALQVGAGLAAAATLVAVAGTWLGRAGRERVDAPPDPQVAAAPTAPATVAEPANDPAAEPAPAAPLALARAARPVTILRGVQTRAGTELVAGDAVLLEDGAPLALELEGGARLELEPPAVLVLAGEPGRAAVLQLGGLSARAAPDALLDLDTGFAQLRLEPGATARLSVAADDSLNTEGVEPWNVDRAALAERPPFPRVAYAFVLDGRGELAQGRTVEPLRAGQHATVGSEPGSELGVPRKEAVRLEELLALAAEAPWADGVGKEGYASPFEAVGELLERLERRPQGWDVLAEPARRMARDPETTRNGLRRVLVVAALNPSDDALELGRELWLEAPEAFDADLVIAFAERGAFELEREARAMLDAPPPPGTDPLVDLLERTAVAAHLALGGDAAGAAVLREMLEEPPRGVGVLMAQAFARVGLAALGEPVGDDPAADAEAMRRSVAEQVDALLAAGQWRAAARFLVGADQLMRLERRGREARLGLFDTRVELALQAYELDSEQAVRALRQRLLPE